MLIDVAHFDVALHRDGIFDSVRSEADERNESDGYSTMDIFCWDLVLRVRINVSPLVSPLPVLAEIMIGNSLALSCRRDGYRRFRLVFRVSISHATSSD